MYALGHCDFARLIGAFFFVALGAAFALLLSGLIFSPPDVDFGASISGTLASIKAWTRHEDREKAFYAFTILFGTILGGVGAARWSTGRRITYPTLIILAALVVVAPIVIDASIRASRMMAGLYAAAAIAGLLVVIWLAERLSSGGPEAAATPVQSNPFSLFTGDRVLPHVLASALAVAILTIVAIPLSATGIAAAIGFDMHMASFMAGPATYSFGNGLIPGIDYFTQYSVGTPWLFSFFLAPTATQTMVNAVWFVVAEMLFFSLTLFFFLWWFLRSWWWALVLALACLLLQFTTPSPLYAPSSTSARFPFLIVAVAALVHWVGRHYRWQDALMLAAALAISLFLNTETGIYASVASAITLFVVTPGFVRQATRTIALAVATLVFFMILSLIAFGPGVLQLSYLLFLVEPMLLYSEGLGAWAIEWKSGYYWIYNIISPALALATVGWVAVSARRVAPPAPAAYLAGLSVLSLIGVFLTAKYINMSIVGLWQVNSMPFFAVAAWWARALLDRLPTAAEPAAARFLGIDWNRLSPRWLPLRTQASLLLAVLLVWFLFTIEDRRNPSLYAIPSYKHHPTLVNYLLGSPDPHPCPQERSGCAKVKIPPGDVALIDSLTGPKDRVALFMLYDWATLIEAKRASKFHFLPSTVVFTDRQVEASLRDIDLMFLPREPADKLGINHPDLESRLIPMLRRDFKVVAETPTLLAWRRVK